ncbi:MAG TPA: hypothetical protein VNO52_05515 [Methylomirabilota bacterium]|nr:hypothetical protein [Methylomirabilota bacterium]
MTTLPVLGVPVRFASNDPTAAREIEGRYGAWRPLVGRADLLSQSVVHVRIIVHRAGNDDLPNSLNLYRLPDRERLVVVVPGGIGVADLLRKDAVAYVSPALVEASDRFHFGLLEALTLFLVAHEDRQPLHAAAVTRRGMALLLAGSSGVGKSTLAYAALSRGFSLLSDDVAYLQVRPRMRVWGKPGQLSLPRDAVRFFPELGTVPPAWRPGGEKVVVSVPVPKEDCGLLASDAMVCLVERGETLALESVDSATIAEALRSRVEPGFDLFLDTMRDAILALAATGGWRIMLGDSPAAAAALLREAVDGARPGR